MEEKSINGINYRLDKETLTAEVIWNGGDYSGDVVIPDTVVSDTVSYSVTSIGDAAFACRGKLNADSKSTNEQSITARCGILCFLFPVVGWILHLTWKKESPEKAKVCDTVARWGFLFNYAIYLLAN